MAARPLLRQACRDEQTLHLRYRDQDGQEAARGVWPLGIVFLDRSLLLLAFCRLRMDFRRFQLDRIVAVQVLEHSFRPRRVPLLRDVFAAMRARPPG